MKTKGLTNTLVNSEPLKNLILTSAIAAALVLSACAKVDTASSIPADDLSGGIIGGSAVSNMDPIAKTVVAIYDTQEQTLCTGSILSNQLVITAGHCANKANPRAMVLLFGTVLPTKGGPKPVARQVVDLRLNPRYEQVTALFEQNQKVDPDTVKEWGDVSILKFVGGLPPGYQPAQILSNKSFLKTGGTVTLAGYGEIDGVHHLGSNQLNKVDVVLADVNFSASEVMMDQRQGKGACHGDSGGPAYVTIGGKMYLFGVTSRGIKDPGNNCSSFSIYSVIPSLMSYISPAANDLLKAPVPNAPTPAPAPVAPNTRTPPRRVPTPPPPRVVKH